MATVLRTEGIVYRRGKRSDREFTPRPSKDTQGRPGQAPGLSTMETLSKGEKGQEIDLALLRFPLPAIADNPEEGGTPGHVTIVPVNEAGEIGQPLLEEWAASRDTDVQHPLTRILLEAIVEANVLGPT